MEDHEFRDFVVKGITALQTKMDALVGEKGNNGRVGELEVKVDSLNLSRSHAAGFVCAIFVFWTIALGVAEYFIHKK